MDAEELLEELEWEADLPLGQTLHGHSATPQRNPAPQDAGSTQAAKRHRSDDVHVLPFSEQTTSTPATGLNTAEHPTIGHVSLPRIGDAAPASTGHAQTCSDLDGSDENSWGDDQTNPAHCDSDTDDDAASISSSDVSHDVWADEHDDLTMLYDEQAPSQPVEPTEAQRNWQDRQCKGYTEFSEKRPGLMATHIATLGPPEGARCMRCAANVAVVGCSDCSLDASSRVLLCAECDHKSHPTAHFHRRRELRDGAFTPIPSSVMFKPAGPGELQCTRIEQSMPSGTRFV
jgi:hypothetical protein